MIDIEKIRKEAANKNKRGAEYRQLNVRIEKSVYERFRGYCERENINATEAVRGFVEALISGN